MKHLLTAGILVAGLVLAACSSKDEPPPPPQAAPEGRAETRSIRNTQAIGYNGTAIANKVDAALKANDEEVKKTDKAVDESTGEQDK